MIMLLLGLQTLVLAQSKPVLIGYSSDTAQVSSRVREILSLPSSSFRLGKFRDHKGIEIQYRLYIPPEAKNSINPLPLVVVFHGSGQIGTDNEAQLGVLPKLFASPEIQQKYPSYILAPQFPTRSSDYSMDTARQVLASSPRACVQTAIDLVDSLIHYLHADRSRIYAVGYSMGASTTINALSMRPGLFAAGISLAGIPQFNKGRARANIPLWLIHGLRDDVNSAASDLKFFNEFNRRNMIFWQLENTNHNIFTAPAILGTALPDWLFKQKRSL